MRLHPAQFARLDFEIVRQICAGQGERNLVADFVVLRPANDLAQRAAPIIDLADAEAIGVWMRRGSGDLRDNDLRKIRAAALNSFNLDAGQSEQIGQLGGVVRQLDEFGEPVEGKFHVALSLVILRAAKDLTGVLNLPAQNKPEARP